MRKLLLPGAAIVGLAIAAISCGGSNGAVVPSTATIHLAAAGVSKASILLTPGGTLTVVNDDTVAHQLMSDPHPAHNTCPELNMTPLAAGATTSLTMAAVIETCPFHDEIAPTNTAFQGQVQTQANSGGGGGGGNWVVGNAGTVAHGSSAESYGVVASPTTEDLLSLFCVEGAPGTTEQGWAVGTRGVVLHTPDGVQWTAQSSGIGATLRAVAFADPLHGVAAGDGAARVTADGGQHWDAAVIPAVTITAAAFAPDGLHAWLATADGRIFASVDAAHTFAEAASLGTPLRAIRFASDARHGIAAGDGGRIFVTIDGIHWSSGATAPHALRGLHLSGDGRLAIAVGEGGLVWRSTNGGSSWRSIATGTILPLNAVGFAANGRDAWIAGNAGLLLHSPDGGASWHRVSSPTFADLHAVEDDR